MGKNNFLCEVPFIDVVKESASWTVGYSMEWQCLVYHTLVNMRKIVYLCICPHCHNILDRFDNFFQSNMEEFGFQLEVRCEKCNKTFPQEEMNLLRLGYFLGSKKE